MADLGDYGVLIVDDEEPIVKNLRRILKRKGFTKIVSALNGEQAVKLLENAENKFFLIISDQRMPGMSGSEFLEKSILLSPESRRMMLTGYSDFSAIIDAVNKGAIHQYISKLWDNTDLLLKIFTELAIYKQFQEQKRLYKLTRYQNSKLFELAANLRKQDKKFKKKLAQKKEEMELLKQGIADAKAESEKNAVSQGLDELLTRTISINQDNLVQVFSMVKGEISTMMEKTAQKNQVSFFSKNSENIYIDVSEIKDETFETIDQVIEIAVQKVEPIVCDIGSESGASNFDSRYDYDVVPDFGTLALNDGYITENEFKRVREELERAREELEKKEEKDAGRITIDKILVARGFIRRNDLSRIFVKLAFIERRLMDHEFTKELLNREVVSKKDIDRAFLKQLNDFEESGAATAVADILIESEIITLELKDEIDTSLDITGKKRISAIDPGSAVSLDFDAFVDLQISEDRLKAYIRVPKSVHGIFAIEPIKRMIKKRSIKYGVVNDMLLRGFIRNCTNPEEKFVVATGDAPDYGKSADIVYHFSREKEIAGVVAEDGTIDFHETGKSAYVKKGALLAELIPPKRGKPGRDIFGETIPVSDVENVSLKCGDGAEISKDGLKTISKISGQPTLDLNGVVSVVEELYINGDVNFKTGNIHFKGNVVVNGIITDGFTIECEQLTANEISGGIIRISGDLKVYTGIVNADIETKGNIQAKFINRSKVYGFGNIMVTREIIESYIAVSGEIYNKAGRIMSSNLAARKGFNVIQIGTEKSERSTIRMGVDDHIKWLAGQFDAKMNKIQTKLDVATQEKMEYEEQKNTLHVDVSNQTSAQEKITKKIDFMEEKLGQIEDNKDEKIKLGKDIKELEKVLEQVDDGIKAVFEEQDKILKKIEVYDEKIMQFNVLLEDLKQEKETSIEFLELNKPVAVLKVKKKIFAGTRIDGTMTSMIVKRNTGTSKFMEIDSTDPGSPGEKQIVY